MTDTIDTQPKKISNFKYNNTDNNQHNKAENKNNILKDLCSQYTDDYYNCMKQFDDFKLCIIHFDNIIKCLIIQEPHHSQ